MDAAEEAIRSDIRLEGENLVRVKTGRPVTAKPNKRGYRSLRVRKFQLYYHRVKFFLLHGYWPQDVDHKDRDPSNNSSDNLRAATRETNMWNLGDVRGWSKKGNHYVAYASKDNRTIHIGSYPSPQEAEAAYLAWVKENRVA